MEGNNSTDKSLATELLYELKRSAKRWFFAFLIMVILEVGTIIGFLWYMSLPVDEYSNIDQQATDRSINVIGDNYGSTPEDDDV